MATRIKPETKSVYDQDFYVWTEVQTELLRQRQFEDLDLANLIEEVEGLGDAKKSAVLSNATVVIEHLLKLQLSPATRPPARLGRFRPRAPQPTSSSSSRRGCARSSRTSCRASTSVARRTAERRAAHSMARTPRPPACPQPAPTRSTRSPATGGRERGPAQPSSQAGLSGDGGTCRSRAARHAGRRPDRAGALRGGLFPLLPVPLGQRGGRPASWSTRSA